VAGTVQNVNAAVPVHALSKPPEGQKTVTIDYTFTPLIYQFSESYQLNSPGGLNLSQVLGLTIDNTQNPLSLTVIYGPAGNTIVVPALTITTIPTVSTRSYFPITLALAQPPSANVEISVTYSNVTVNSGQFGNNALFQGSSAVGSVQANQYSAVIPDTGFSASISIVGTLQEQYIGIGSAMPGQRYSISQFEIFAYNVQTNDNTNYITSLGLSPYSSDFGQWSVPSAANLPSGYNASTGYPITTKSGLYIRPNAGDILYVSIQALTSRHFTTGTVMINAFGIILPQGA
jgi:hypothetical protein